MQMSKKATTAIIIVRISKSEKWCESGFAPQEVKAVYTYLSKGTIIADLIDAGIFTLNEKGKLSDEKIANTDPADCFVRFSVDGKSYGKTRACIRRI